MHRDQTLLWPRQDPMLHFKLLILILLKMFLYILTPSRSDRVRAMLRWIHCSCNRKGFQQATRC